MRVVPKKSRLVQNRMTNVRFRQTIVLALHHCFLVVSLYRGFTKGCKFSPNKYFELKKTCGAPMGHPKLELLASNGVATFVMPFSITLNARVTPGCTMQKYECIRVLNTNQEAASA